MSIVFEKLQNKKPIKKISDKKQYKEAIRIWTEYDPLKMKTAKGNKLNYLTIYN